MRERGSHRDALLEGAITCIQEKGYARTTARELVAASGTNLGSIGYHYGSKERLLNEALFEAFRRWLLPLVERASATDPASAWAGMRDSLTVLFEDLEEHRPLITSFFEAVVQAQHSDELRGQLAALYDGFRQANAAAIASALGDAGPDAGVDPEVIASFLMAGIDGLLVQWLLDPEKPAHPRELFRSVEGTLGLLAAGAGATRP
jgi:AcrR family transcriptional regulator